MVLETLKGLFEEYIEGHPLQRLQINDSPLITVSGGICTGKTYVTTELAKKYGLGYYSVGSEIRRIANQKKMTIEDFVTHLHENHKEALLIDLNASYSALEKMAKGGEKETGLVTDGQLAGWYGVFLKSMKRENVFNFNLQCDEETRKERLLSRDSKLENFNSMTVRNHLDEMRWKNLGIDINDISIYDLVLNTACLTKKEVIDSICCVIPCV
ncbi:MAG: AAA family ATPase [Candidatus Aenigmarchaeota archaeon]|nr:AAA family ATPase [Candidatus Aenigmarchaeota archaeon]